MSRKNLGAKPYLFPQPVMMIGTYDKDGNPNVMNAAWGGIVGADKIIVDLGSHKTTDNIMLKKAFTISIADVDHVIACDYVGIVSANSDPDKFKKTGFTAEKSEFVDAPIIKELPLALECELVTVYEGGKYLGTIKNVSADESILENGNVSLEKFFPITFDMAGNNYYRLGEKVGNAFKDGAALK
ncbi:flavin reductase family protein [Ruminococcus sp.]|uniref:flavin reductase family protein n=1 Tax=Ruminococcus sp. TaxID=41978 RepID=UPI0025F1DDDF|nr:flavin reductase family protein [Ruminococcus sp.]